MSEYTDEYFNVHIKDEEIGKGGQGVVFRTKDPDVAIKLLIDSDGNPVNGKDIIADYYNKVRMIRRLPLPDGINLSVPIALLRDHAGYVMQLLSEMIPFSTFLVDGKISKEIPAEQFPSWLEGMQENDARKIVHYNTTGGLRRRLVALCKCSTVLARLHGNGIVYGDISLNNAFISEDVCQSEVWLIDTDNLRYETSSGGRMIFTPKFGAPELVQGVSGTSFATDCHSFAVMAFYILSMIHPFIGGQVDGSGDADWADDDSANLEVRAYAGYLPWVDDTFDDSNSSNCGLPRELVLTERLAELCQCTFGEGRNSPNKRPAIYHWPEALAEAADRTIICPSCEMSWYYSSEGTKCPFCRAKKPTILLLESYRWLGEKKLDTPCWTYARELLHDGFPMIFPERVFQPFTIVSNDKNIIEMTISSQKMTVTKLDDCSRRISIARSSADNNSFVEIVSKINLPVESIKSGIWIHCDGPEPRLIKCSTI